MRFSSLLSATLSFAAVVYAQQTNGQNSITFPLGGVLDASLPLTIKWTPSTTGTITIKLLRGPPTNILDVEVVAASISNTGTFTWNIPKTIAGTSSLPPGERYGLKIIDDLTSTFEYSPPFDISVAASDPDPVAGPTSTPASSTSSPPISTDLPSSTSSTPTESSAPASLPSTTDAGPPSTTASTETSTDIPPTSTPAASSTGASISLPTTFATTTRAAQPTDTQNPDVQDALNLKSNSSGPNIVLIAGVTAGVVGLGLAALAIFMILKRRSKRRESAHIPMRERPHSDATYNRVKG